MSLTMRLLGVPELRAQLRRIELAGDAATIAAIKAIQNKAKAKIRSKMRGAPRWNRRGKSSRTGAEVTVPGPRRRARSGGPGKLTGELISGIDGMKRPRGHLGVWTGAVWVGKGGVRNLYKWKVEEQYPYFDSGIAGMEGEAEAIWLAAWQKVFHKRTG